MNTTLLVVEDDPVDIELMKRTYATLDLSIDLQFAETADIALAMLNERKVDWPWIVAIDLNLGSIDGFTLIDKIRDSSSLKRSPVFVLTTSEHSNDLGQAFDRQVTGYFTKDQDAARLLSFFDEYASLNHFPLRS